jgi:uncharacterized protein YwgA
LAQNDESRNANDALLLLASLHYYKKPIRGRTRLQKLVYLLKTRYGIPFSFNFRPYYYGPYSDELSNLISFLNALNFTVERAEFLDLGVIRFNYTLTERGKKYLEDIEKKLDKKTLKIIQKLKESITELSTVDTSKLIAEAKLLMSKETG